MSSRASSPLSSASPSPPLRPQQVGSSKSATSAASGAGATSKGKAKAKKAKTTGQTQASAGATVPAPASASSKPPSRPKGKAAQPVVPVSSPPLSDLDSPGLPELPAASLSNGPQVDMGVEDEDTGAFVRSPTSSTMRPDSDAEDDESDLTEDEDEASAEGLGENDDAGVDWKPAVEVAALGQVQSPSPTKGSRSGSRSIPPSARPTAGSASKQVKEEALSDMGDGRMDADERKDKARSPEDATITDPTSPVRGKSPSLTPPPPSSEARAKALPSSPVPASDADEEDDDDVRADVRLGQNGSLKRVNGVQGGDMASSDGSASSSPPQARASSRPKSASAAGSRTPSPKKGIKRKADDMEASAGEQAADAGVAGDGDESMSDEDDADDGDITMRPAQEKDEEDTPNGTAAPTVAGDLDAAASPGEAAGGSPSKQGAASASMGDEYSKDGDVDMETDAAADPVGVEDPVDDATTKEAGKNGGAEGDGDPGGETDAQAEGEEEGATQTPAPAMITRAAHAHSSHPPPPSADAVKALFLLELKFAAIRDRLYIERMEEAAEEEEMLLAALQILHKALSARRERLHEVASRRHAQALDELKIVKQSEHDAVWSWWTEERDSLHWHEFEQTWAKRRRLAREKNELETPRPFKAVPKFDRNVPVPPFNWALGPTPSKLSVDDAVSDWQMMEASPCFAG